MKRKGTESFAISPLLQVSPRDGTVRSGVSIQSPMCPQIPVCPPVQPQPQWPCASSIFTLSLCDADPSPCTCHTVAVQSVGEQTWKTGDLVKWSLKGSLKDTESLVTAWQPLPWVVGSAHSPLPGCVVPHSGTGHASPGASCQHRVKIGSANPYPSSFCSAVCRE